jgi:hypothetical protein
MNRRRFLQVLGASSTAGLAGCPGDQSSDSTPISTNRTTRTEPPSPTATEEQTKTSEEWTVDPPAQDKMVGAFYYPWYDQGYWDSYPSPSTPELGWYDSRDEEVINQHVKWSVDHGINTWIVNWSPSPPREHWVERHFLETELSDEIEFFMQPGAGRFTFDDNHIDLDREENRQVLKNDLRHFDEHYFDQPNYTRIEGRPVVYYYSARWFDGDVTGAFQEATDEIGRDLYLIADTVSARTKPKIAPRDWMDGFDAITDYNTYFKAIVEDGDYDDFVDYVDHTLTAAALLADHHDLDFFPSVVPSVNAQWKGDFPVLERSPEGFTEQCRTPMRKLDQDVDGIFVTSFNEWPEDTSVEPGQEYGQTYLDIIEDEIAGAEPEYVDTSEFDRLEFDFNRTVENGGRPVALELYQMEVVGEDGTERTYNIGIPEQDPYFVEGVFPPQPASVPITEKPADPFETWRTLGRPVERSVMYLDTSALADATLWAIPHAPSDLSAEVRYNDEAVDEVHFNGSLSDPSPYSVSLGGA